MHPPFVDFLRSFPSPIRGGNIFGQNRRFNHNVYNKAVETAGITDFTFQDLRNCAINNLRLAGNGYYTINQASERKKDITSKRYNLLTKE